ncbi:MAG TPA: glycosyltransferase [Candidatus Aquilonibacter sp.]|nr:glycosyltransferase [Candidatus Aquilonibacter sp.]
MPKLALSMIVKNAAADLRDCLESIRGVAEEIVVADTGSHDETMAIAKAEGARVISIPWEDDFAAARNKCLAEVQADWALMLDADERLDPAAKEEFPALLTQERISGFQVTIRNYVFDASKKIWDRPAVANDGSYAPAREFPAYIEHENVRLFRREPKIYFTGRVHESVGWRLRETGRKIGAAASRIHHFGMVRETAETKASKLAYYRKLGRLKAAEEPQNAQAHLELGLVELENGGAALDALGSFRRACELNPGLGVAWYFAGAIHFQRNDFPSARSCLRRAEEAGHTTFAVAELAGDACYHLKYFEEARTWYRRAQQRRPEDAAIESKLGMAEARTGDSTSGLRRIRHAIAMEPSNPQMHDRLIVLHVWLGNAREAGKAAEEKLNALDPKPEDFLRAASIWPQANEWERAEQVLTRGRAMFPESEAIRKALHQIETTHTRSKSRNDARVGT